MELKKGYKQTDIGVFPDEWILQSVDQIFEFHSTSNYSKAQMNTEGEIGCFHYGLIHSITYNNYDIRNGVKYFVTKQQANYEFLKDGDVIMVDASEDLSGVNKSIEISGIQDKLYIAGLHTYLLRDKGFFQKSFRGPILNSYFTRAQFYRLAVGMKVFGVSKQQLKKVLLPIPSISEQIAIASALLDTDAYINSLEKLIEKKRHIKKVAIRELLIPKEGWINVAIRDIAKVGRGRVISHSEIIKSIEGKYPVYSSQTTNNGIMGFIDSYDFEGEYITWTTDGEKAGTVFYRSGKFNCTNVCGTIKLTFGSARFIANILNIEAPKHVSRNLANPKLMNEPMKNIRITIPESLNEQNEIAEIIINFESEIYNLERHLLKLKSLKQGMIQNLLTGKIRLL
jgi:type I restriction enzyme S subunit